MGKKENSKIKKEALKALRRELGFVPSNEFDIGQDKGACERYKLFLRQVLKETKRTSFA